MDSTLHNYRIEHHRLITTGPIANTADIQYFLHIIGGDYLPYEVIRHINDTQLQVRRMCQPFCQCPESDPDGAIITITQRPDGHFYLPRTRKPLLPTDQPYDESDIGKPF